MPAKVTVKTVGGDRFREALGKAGKGGIGHLDVGFFATAKYPDGTQVAAVAAWNEFGTTNEADETHIPERPFFRQAVDESEDEVLALLKAGTDPERGVVTPAMADRIGAYLQGQIQQKIVALREPPNAPSTVKAKGSSNPLIDDGVMLGSVSWLAGGSSEVKSVDEAGVTSVVGSLESALS